MIVVSDSTPLIALAASGHVDLLERLFGTVYVPDAVYREVAEDGAGLPGASELLGASWVRRQPVRDQRFVAVLAARLDLGEAMLVLLDEKRARRQADALGLEVTGTLGLLVLAKRRGMIEAVGPVLSALTESDFYFTESLRARVLAACDER